MWAEILILVLVTLIPFFELRFSIPLGILAGSVNLPFGLEFQGLGMNWVAVFLICVITNALLGPAIYFLLDKFVHLLVKINFFGKIWGKFVGRTQKRIKPYVDKYGDLGLALFIGVPLPGSGSYSGAMGAYLLGMKHRRFVLANLIGVTIAGILVTIITLSGKGLWQLLF